MPTREQARLLSGCIDFLPLHGADPLRSVWSSPHCGACRLQSIVLPAHFRASCLPLTASPALCLPLIAASALFRAFCLTLTTSPALDLPLTAAPALCLLLTAAPALCLPSPQHQLSSECYVSASPQRQFSSECSVSLQARSTRSLWNILSPPHHGTGCLQSFFHAIYFTTPVVFEG